MRKEIKYILFDLDGTITDPFEGISKSVEYSLEKFGIKVSDRKKLLPFIGPPLKYSYMTYFDMSADDAERAVAYYREFYPYYGIFDCTLYPGIKELLEVLSSDHKLILATSKPQPFAEQILEKFDLSKYFYKVVGATFDDKVSEKTDVIKKILCDFSIDPSEAIMIGDRFYDTKGAYENGMDAIGVTYGFGAREEFDTAVFIADTVNDIRLFFSN